MEVESISTDATTEPTADGNPSKLGMCEVCASREAKYTCPKCEVKTCSLKCNKIHKHELECDGQRDKTKFIPINKFTNLDLSSDYRLLEEISRTVEVARKNFGKREDKEILPIHLFKLRNAAKSRKTNLKFLPYKFARHRNNTTRLNFKTATIHWHIDWIFTNADNLKCSDKKIPETEKLSSVLDKYFTKQENQLMQEKLQYYQSADISGVRIFLKAEQRAGKKFYELDPSQTIRECLQKKLIIEHPTIFVVFKDHGAAFDVIDSDDEDNNNKDDVETKSGKAVVDQIITRAENDDSLYKSMKNLLFVSEYSDEESE